MVLASLVIRDILLRTADRAAEETAVADGAAASP
jgi:hypothetical protein